MSREPDFAGSARAWKMERGPDARPEQAASLAGYVVNGPYHPLWSWWMVSVIHLRDIPGVKPAHRRYPEAEYELTFVSIDPDTPPDPNRPFPQDVRYLAPPDLVFQFHGVSDADAAAICEKAAERIAEGISCDSDFRFWWEGALATTVEHFRQGLHGTGPGT